MKYLKPIRLLVVMMLSLLLVQVALAEAPAPAPAPVPMTMETVLATVNGEDIPYAQVRKFHESLLSQYSSMMDVSDPSVAQMFKEAALNYAVTERLILQKAKELGLDQFTDEELANMNVAADSAYQNVFEQYKGMFAVEGKSEEDQSEAAEAFLDSNGYSRENVLEQLKGNELYTRVMATVSYERTLTEEQLRALFDQKVEEAKAAYEADKSKFDSDNMGGGVVYFVPEGVRAFKHILVMMDQTEVAQIKAYQTELAALPEGDAGREEIQKKIDDMMAVVQPKLSEIQAKIEAGEDFQSLIDAYGEDPGMQAGSPYEQSGYYLSEATKVFEVPFTEAALALEKVGDISEPVLGSMGFHIVRYERDVPSQAVDFELVKDQLQSTELAAAKQKAESDAVAEWSQATAIETFLDRFN